MRQQAISLALGLAAVHPASAAPCLLQAEAEAVAPERALDGDTVLLDDGREVRLAGIVAPKAPLGQSAEAWPFDLASRTALQRATADRVMELRLAGRSPDRYGRLVGYLAEIEAADHAGVTSALLAAGLARVIADAGGRDCEATLRAAERQAADARLGLWSDPYYEIRNAADGAALAAEAGRFVVAEGRVASVRIASRRAYVNFGARWRGALSLTLSEAALRKLGGFATLGAVAGARLRVRGVVEVGRGPTIFVSEAAQIEPIPDAGLKR
jgi:micrococcal nuclease